MAGPSDPSMEEILASIKKVIDEEPPIAAPARPDPEEEEAEAANEDDVLDLEAEMTAEPGTGHQPDAPPAAAASLMADDKAGGARASLDELANVASNAPAGGALNPMEEMVREMLRPMLKQWLDERLPGIIDEHVRAEISRITGRKL